MMRWKEVLTIISFISLLSSMECADSNSPTTQSVTTSVKNSQPGNIPTAKPTGGGTEQTDPVVTPASATKLAPGETTIGSGAAVEKQTTTASSNKPSVTVTTKQSDTQKNSSSGTENLNTSKPATDKTQSPAIASHSTLKSTGATLSTPKPADSTQSNTKPAGTLSSTNSSNRATVTQNPDGTQVSTKKPNETTASVTKPASTKPTQKENNTVTPTPKLGSTTVSTPKQNISTVSTNNPKSTAVVPTQKGNGTEVSTQKPSSITVSTLKPNGTAVSTQKPENTPVPTQKTNSTAVPTQKANSTAVPTQKANSTAVSTQKPSSITVSTQKANSTAVPTQKTNSTAVPTQKTAVPTQKTNSTAVPTQKTNSTAVPTQKTNSTAVPTQKTNSTAVSTQKPSSITVSTQKLNTTVVPTQKENVTTVSTQKEKSTTVSGNITVVPTQTPNNTVISTQKPESTPVSTQKENSTAVSTQQTANKSATTQTPEKTSKPPMSSSTKSATTSMRPSRKEFVYINEIMVDKNGGFQKVELLLSKQFDRTNYVMVMVDGSTDRKMSVVYLKDMVQQKNGLLVVSFNSSQPSMMDSGTGVAIYDMREMTLTEDWTVSEAGLVDALVIGKTYTGVSEHLTETLTPGVNPFILDPNKYGMSKTISRCSSDQLRSTDMFALINPSFGADNKKKCRERLASSSDFAIKMNDIDCSMLEDKNGTATKYDLTVKKLLHYIVKKVNTECQCGVTRMHIIDPKIVCCDGASVDMRFVAPNKAQLNEFQHSYRKFLKSTKNINVANHLYPIDNTCDKHCCGVPKNPKPQKSDDTAKNVKVTVAVIVSCLIVFMIVVIIVIMYMRRKKSAVYQFRMSRLDEEDDFMIDGPDQDDFVGGQEATFDTRSR